MTVLAQRLRGYGCCQGAATWALLLAAAGSAAIIGSVLSVRGREPSEVVLAAAFTAVLLAIAWVDLERRVIPNWLVYPALVAALAISGVWPDRGLAEASLGGFGAFAVSAFVRGVSRGGLGAGDVKMAALAGAVVGSPGILYAGILACLAGGTVAAVTLASREVRSSDSLPYGPFLAVGVFGALLR